MLRLFLLFIMCLTFGVNVQAQDAANSGYQTLDKIYTMSREQSSYFALHGTCYEIINRKGNVEDLVLTGDTRAEWESFIEHAENDPDIELRDCPVEYSGWTDGACSATCGGGTMTQTRTCTFLPTGETISCAYCGGDCSGTTTCNEQACAGWVRECPTDPSVDADNDPATCGMTCTVTCEANGVAVDPSECEGTPPATYISFPIGECPVGDWVVGDWGACSVACGGGTQTRDVSCPSGNCSGTPPTSEQACNIQPCTGCEGGNWVLATNNTNQSLQDGQNFISPDEVFREGEIYCVCPDGTNLGTEGGTCPGDPCTAPWGETVNDGGQVRAYQTSTVPYGQSCVNEWRVCNDGVLSGTYQHQSCVVDPPENCALPWGGTLLHGQSVYAYQSTQSPGPGQDCVRETRTCNNGVLSGTYQYSSCTITDPLDCDLPWGGTLPHGDSVTAYQAENVPSTSTCQSEDRVCNNGTLSGSYTFQNCTVDEPSCTIRKERIYDWNTSRGTTRGCAIRCEELGLVSVYTDEFRRCESNETGYYPGKSTALYWEDDSLRCYSQGQRHDGDRSDKTQYCYCGASTECNGLPYEGGSGSGSGGGGGGGGGTGDENPNIMNELLDPNAV